MFLLSTQRTTPSISGGRIPDIPHGAHTYGSYNPGRLRRFSATDALGISRVLRMFGSRKIEGTLGYRVLGIPGNPEYPGYPRVPCATLANLENNSNDLLCSSKEFE